MGNGLNKKLDAKKIFQEFGILIAFVALVCVLMAISPNAFARPTNFINILKQASVNGILAMGMMFVIISGGIDLSVGSTVALSGVVAALFSHPGEHPLWMSIVLAVLVGLAVGIFNGVGVAYGGIPPFIVTLGTMTAVRGLALIVSGGTPVYNVSPEFEKLAAGFIGPVPYLAVYYLIIAAICAFVLNKTVFGRRVYAVGGNEIAASVSGINVKLQKIGVYAINGALAGLCGLILASRTVSGSPTAGQAYEMDAITAVIIGGVSMSGGSGKWYGTVIGALFIAVMGNGLDILNVSSNYQQLIKGAIIILAVLFDIKGKGSAKN